MPRWIKMIANLVVFIVGAAALVHTNFWDWNRIPGLVMPIGATLFLLYLLVLLALGARSDPPTDTHH
jgi:hypothetical protein